jgi:hypothetical protein
MISNSESTEDYLEKLEARLNHLWAEIKRSTAKTEEGKGKQKEYCAEWKAELKSKHEEVKKKLKEVE